MFEIEMNIFEIKILVYVFVSVLKYFDLQNI